MYNSTLTIKIQYTSSIIHRYVSSVYLEFWRDQTSRHEKLSSFWPGNDKWIKRNVDNSIKVAWILNAKRDGKKFVFSLMKAWHYKIRGTKENDTNGKYVSNRLCWNGLVATYRSPNDLPEFIITLAQTNRIPQAHLEKAKKKIVVTQGSTSNSWYLLHSYIEAIVIISNNRRRLMPWNQ